MGRKYIGQQTDYNFVYPNFDPAIYDVEIVHDINDNSISGTVTNFTGTSITSTGMTISYNWTWSKNGAEPYINNIPRIHLLSTHMMGPTQLYYKPWRMVDYVYSATTTGTTYSGTTSFSVTPAQLGLSSFTNGNYQFEIRFIGKRSIYPICQSLTVSSIIEPTPTPTPTPTVTPIPPTPSPTPLNIYTTGATLNVTDTGWIKYNMSTGSTYQFIGSTGVVTLTNCLDCSSIMVGIPFADVANFTILGCGSSCTPPPPPTPSGKSLQIYVNDDAPSRSTMTLFYSINGSGNINVPGATATLLPASCSFVYTITGLNTLDSIVFGTSNSCVMNGNGSSSSCPFSSGSATTFTYVIDAPTTQQVALTVDSSNIP